jgi:hypothetical protein
VSLRNALVHFNPRFRTSEDDKALAEKLRSKNLRPNPFTGGGNPFFPDQCLSHGYARWGWDSALSFVEESYTRVGVTAPHNLIRAELDPLLKT